jgi:hypothetical protein
MLLSFGNPPNACVHFEASLVVGFGLAIALCRLLLALWMRRRTIMMTTMTRRMKTDTNRYVSAVMCAISLVLCLVALGWGELGPQGFLFKAAMLQKFNAQRAQAQARHARIG